MYFNPVPVLNNTTRSCSATKLAGDELFEGREGGRAFGSGKRTHGSGHLRSGRHQFLIRDGKRASPAFPNGFEHQKIADSNRHAQARGHCFGIAPGFGLRCARLIGANNGRASRCLHGKSSGGVPAQSIPSVPSRQTPSTCRSTPCPLPLDKSRPLAIPNRTARPIHSPSFFFPPRGMALSGSKCQTSPRLPCEIPQIFPQSEINPSTNSTCAPKTLHST